MGAVTEVSVSEMEKEIAALHIETFAPTRDPSGGFSRYDPDSVELLSIGLALQYSGTRPGAGPDETMVILRENASPVAEHRLVSRAVSWLIDRNPSVLVTFDGAQFGALLEGRAKRAADVSGIESDVDALLEPWFTDHNLDLKSAAKERYGEEVTFDLLCQVQNITPVSVEWEDYDILTPQRPQLEGKEMNPSVSPRDIEEIGKMYIKSQNLRGNAEGVTLLFEYTQQPLPALLELTASYPFRE